MTRTFALSNFNMNRMNLKEIASNAQVQVVLNITDLRELFLEWQEQASETPNAKEETFLTPDEVSKMYRVSKVTLWRNAKAGYWPSPVKVGRKTLYRKSEMEAIFNPKK